MNATHKKLYSATGLVILAVVFLAVIAVSQVSLKGLRLDLTENQLYTLSDGTHNILRNIDEPVNLNYYFSDTETTSEVQLRSYADRVREKLEEIARQSDGKVRLNIIDPVPFSEAEDEAAGYGLTPLPLRGGSNAYFGLAGTNAIDGVETIPLFQWTKPGFEEFLEYDIARMIYSLANPKRPVVGISSGLPVTAGFDPMTRRPRAPWVVVSQIEQLFDVRDLGVLSAPVDEDVDVLMLIHPKNITDDALFAIDQFVLRGGRLMVFVDPYADVDIPPQDPSNPVAAFMADRSSNLKRLFDQWGIEVPAKEFAADDRYALQVGGAGNAPVKHLAFIGLEPAVMNNSDVVTADINLVNVAMSGFVRQLDGASTTLTPLLSTSENAAALETDRLRFLQDPGSLRDGFEPGGAPLVIAARVAGEIQTAFPEGAPGDVAADAPPALTRGTLNAIVVADVDMLADRLWVQTQNFLGQVVHTAWANNGDFVVNAMDNFTGSTDLIAVRGRAVFSRPFEKVQALQRKADDRFRATEQGLQDKLMSLEQRLADLQTARNDDSLAILTDEQSSEIQRFVDQRGEVRRQLRQVRRDLDKDIENLHTRLKLINIVLVPVLLSVIALVSLMIRNRRRRVPSGAGR